MTSFLDDFVLLRRIDRSDMLGKVAALGSTAQEGYRLGMALSLPSLFHRSKQLLILGMGGSAIGGDLIQGLGGDPLGLPIAVHRSYTVPSWVGPDTLVVAISYSGNTEETLASAQEALRRGAKLIAIASGGRLMAWGTQRKIPTVIVPSGWPPRAALGFLAFAPLGILCRLGWMEPRRLRVEQACRELKEYVDQKLAPSVSTAINPAKRLALRLKAKLPILYGASGGWEGITYRWRTQLEENAKTLAFHHVFPEATHNELSGWVQPRGLMRRTVSIFLTDPEVHLRIRRRMAFMQRVVRAQGAEVLPVEVPGRSRLSRSLKLIALGDFASVYLGILYRVDPTPVERVEALKKYMARAG